ncbi:MAG: hypothetical protein AAF493_22380 [Pseudomonadota bacterium]
MNTTEWATRTLLAMAAMTLAVMLSLDLIQVRSLHRLGVVATALVIGGGGLWILFQEIIRATQCSPDATPFRILGLIVFTGFGVAGAFYGYYEDRFYGVGFTPHVYRTTVILALNSLCVLALVALIAPRVSAHRITRALTFLNNAKASYACAGVVLVVSISAAGVLGWMPHTHDATTHLLEGRILWTEFSVYTPAPAYPELFLGHLRTGEDGWYGKYPIGWPIVLGLFDRLATSWIANPIVAVGLVLGVGALVRRAQGGDFANTCMVFMALSPWLALNAGTQLSHLASGFWLVLFALFFRLEPNAARHCFLAGLCLGAAIITRPADAAFFAIPFAVVGLVKLVRDPRPYAVGVVLAGIGPLIGVAIYLFVNWHTTGSISTTGYGVSGPGAPITKTLSNMSPDSAWSFVLWLQESWVSLNHEWFASAFPVGFFVAVGAWIGRAYVQGLGLFLAGSGSLFLAYGFFQFGDITWVGPRWYVPLIPAVAIVCSAGIFRAIHEVSADGPHTRIASRYLALVVVTLAIAWLIAMPTRAIGLIMHPPHGVDRQVLDVVSRERLNNAVVALPSAFANPGTNTPSYKVLRTAIWTMRFPVASNPVIYVATVKGWTEKARAMWPQRALFEIHRDPGRFELREIRPKTSPSN